MPLTVSVGLSRKASENYQSAGASISLTAELDQCLLVQPDQLQQQIDRIYQLAEIALTRQVARQVQSAPPAAHADSGKDLTNGGGTDNGRANGQPAPMTASQSRAIAAIAKRLGVDAMAECRRLLDVELDKLSIRQASQLIDHLKALAPEGQKQGKS